MTGLWILAGVLGVLAIGGSWLAWYVCWDESPRKATLSIVAIIVVAIGIVTWNWAFTFRNDHWATCTITGKDRGGSDGSYRVYTSDCGQLANTDSWLRGKLDSADLWQKIPEKGVIRMRIAGSRAGIFSRFPNIFDVEKTTG